MTIQRKITIWQIHPAEESFHPQVNSTLNSYSPTQNIMVFIDCSRTNTGLGADFYTTEGSELNHQSSCWLNDNNSI